MRRATCLLALATAIAFASPALAQRGGGPGGQQLHGGHHPQTAQVGAGTTNGTTTGFSGPKKGGGSKKPAKPDASLCEDYQGEVRQSCLSVAVGMANGAAGGAQSTNKTEEQKK
jgi:hypothetical protein